MKEYGSKPKRKARKALKKSIKNAGEHYPTHKKNVRSLGRKIRNLFN